MSGRKSLRRIGFYLGKFIYLLDAYDDVEEDVKNKDLQSFRRKNIQWKGLKGKYARSL